MQAETVRHLKQAEIFAFLAAMFLIAIVALAAAGPGKDKPATPVLVLSEDEQNYRFDLGSAVIGPEFRKALEGKTLPWLREQSGAHGCDTVEVIGHTDGMPLRARRSTLDSYGLLDETSTAGSNVDLGMLRALEVARFLEDAREQGQLETIRFVLPYSAGQMIPRDFRNGKQFTTRDDSARRRIELRLVRSGELLEARK